jgi:hypothetical protein
MKHMHTLCEQIAYLLCVEISDEDSNHCALEG